MSNRLIKRMSLTLGFGIATLTLSACDGVTVGVGYGYDPFYDSMLWNDYYHDVNVDIDVDRPNRPDRPVRPERPKPPVAKPPARPRPPVARPPVARPPIHRPGPRR